MRLVSVAMTPAQVAGLRAVIAARAAAGWPYGARTVSGIVREALAAYLQPGLLTPRVPDEA